jgi:hypothetical protein
MSGNKPITPICPKCKHFSGMDEVDNHGKVFYLCLECAATVPILDKKSTGKKMTFEQYNRVFSFRNNPIRRKKT